MRKILLKFIIWTIRKYFPKTIKPVFAGEKVIFYQFNWSADVQKKDTSFQDLYNFHRFLNEQSKINYAKIQKAELKIGNGKCNVGNYRKRLNKISF